MIKTSRAKRKSLTHFEQVPLDAVKKALGVDTASRETRPHRLTRSIAKTDTKPKAAGRPR
jgi:hypothetical protein